ncbi:cysteine-rich CWC family protein [Georgfuchsia toluolica]|uniref:cysteine-rich CWC family protein n=1 Tax=Georgfuchsia toluolica TaxID=424218 RepID=UPI001C73CF57
MSSEIHENSRCPKCGAEFRCGAKSGEKTCWCMAQPVLADADTDARDCYCPQCLKELLASKGI